MEQKTLRELLDQQVYAARVVKVGFWRTIWEAVKERGSYSLAVDKSE